MARTDRHISSWACARRDRQAAPASTASFIARAMRIGSFASRNRRIHQHAIAAEFPWQSPHRTPFPTPASTSTGTFACSMMRRILIGFLDAEARTDGSCERHDRAAAEIFELFRHDRIIGAIDHHLEAVLDERFGRTQRLDHVGIERLLVAQHFELHEVPAARLARKAQRPARHLPPYSNLPCSADRSPSSGRCNR